MCFRAIKARLNPYYKKISAVVVALILLFISLFVVHPIGPFGDSVTTSFTEYNGQNGRVYSRYAANWNAAVIATTAYAAPDLTQLTVCNSPSTNILQRGFTFFDTSGLDDGVAITGVSLSIPISAAYYNNHLYIQASGAGNSFEQTDYNRANFGDLYVDYNWDGSTGTKNITFTDNIGTSINKEGISTFVIRYYNDYANSAPSRFEGFECANEDQITLWVTYDAAGGGPVLSDETPADGATGISLNPDLYITAASPTGDPMNIYWMTNATGTWGQIGSEEGVDNNTYYKTNSSMNKYGTKYWWSINASDAEATAWTNETYYFTTSIDTVTNSNPDPSNSETDVVMNPTLVITVSDTIGHNMNVTFRTNSSGSWSTIDWNASSPNGTYRQTGINMGSYNTKYWWSVNTSCSNGVWDNDTYYFTTSSGIPTTAVYSGPYNTSDSSITITAIGGEAADNVTLYYRYSANNYSDWSPGKDYAVLTAADYVSNSMDSDVNYPQRMWFDEENQLLYVVNALAQNLQIYDVSDSDNMVKLYTLKDSTYHNYVHDVSVKNNWSYGGKDYGNIAFTVGMGSTDFYFNTIRCNLSTQPAYLDHFLISSGEGYTKLGYVQIAQRGNCLYAAVTRLSGKLNIFNVTDPENIVNMSYILGTDIDAGQTDWWWPTWSPDTMHLFVDGAGTNHSLVILDTSDLSNPTYAGYVGPNTDWITLPYYDTDNSSRVYAGVRVGAGGNGDDYLKVFDVSDPENWSIIATGPDLQGTCEWQSDFYTNEWGASRKYDGASNNTGIDVWNFRNISDMYLAGYFSASYTTHSHMQWFDYNSSRIFAMAYGLGGGNTIYIVKWQISLAQESSWYEYDVDTAAPWSWDFNFPKGGGYYEFYTQGNLSGYANESWAASKDTMAFYFPGAPAIVYVDDDADPGWYDESHVATINEAIINITTSEKGTIYIWDGTYTESFDFGDEPNSYGIDIIGNGSSATFITYAGTTLTFTGLSHYNLSYVNVSATGATAYCIVIGGSSDNITISHCNISLLSSSYYGLYVSSGSYCTFHTNNVYGSGGGGSGIIIPNGITGCLIYNNKITGVQSCAIDENEVAPYTRWNTTKTLGTNIIGGPYLGGNYYDDNTEDYDSDGFSEPYLISGDAGVYDYLPLAYPSVIYVDDDADPGWYDASHVATIDEANQNVSKSVKGTIYIWDGTYNGEVVFHDYPNPYGLDVIGNGSSTVFVISSTEDASAFFIQSESWYNVSGINFSGGINTFEIYDGSDNITVFDCNMSVDVPGGCGVYINGENCTIKNCFINGSDMVSTYGVEIGEDAKFNLLYNNSIINVTVSAGDDGFSTKWNTTKTLGTNIMGGPYIGGNYYDDNTNEYSGYGFSTQYTIDGSADYLPLHNGSLNTTIRNTGEDYFVWLGENTSAYHVAQLIDGFNGAAESISVWNGSSWTSDGLWQKYNGTGTGVNWTIYTFAVVRVILADSGTQTFWMSVNYNMDYASSQAIKLINSTNLGVNFSGYNKIAATSLTAINTSLALTPYYYIALWNTTTYTWNYWIVGFWEVNKDVLRWDVVMTKVPSIKTWNT